MLKRLSQYALIVWVMVFFGVIAPGHQRGAITAAGAGSDAAMAAASCPLCETFTLWGNPGSDDPDAAGDGGSSAPLPQPSSCAICLLIAHLLCQPTELPALDLFERLPWFASWSWSQSRPVGVALEPYWSRGPPTA